jgi:4-amino-4-deoxy-L-arabinose transferase-like glycosyltransferase
VLLSAPVATSGRRAWPSLAQLLPLAVIVLVAVELRLMFQTGMVHFDGWVYAQLAHRLADGVSPFAAPLPPRWTTVRIGLYGPVAVLYWLFGTGNAVTLAWPFACSLAAVCGAYAIGRRLAGESAGLIAALLWALLPTDIAASTTLLGDGLIAALSMGMVWFLLVAEDRRGAGRVWTYVAAFACLMIGILTKPLILLLMPFLVIYFIRRAPRTRLAWILLVAFLVAGFLFYLFATATPEMRLATGWRGWADVEATLAVTVTRWWSLVVLGNSDFSWISPLWVVAIAALLAQRRREAYVVLVWLGSMFLYLEMGTRSPFAYEPLYFDPNTPARHFLVVAAPAVIATGIYLAGRVSARTARAIVILVAAAVGVIAWVGARHALNLSWEVTGEAAAKLPFAAMSAIATGMVVFGGIASPVVVTGEAAAWKSVGLTLLLIAIGLGSLNPSYRAANQFRFPSVKTYPEAVKYLEKQPPLPILVQNQVFGLQMDYASGFRLGFDSWVRTIGPGARIRVAPADPNVIGDSFVLIDDSYVRTASFGSGPSYFKNPPANWVEAAKFGDRPGYQLRVYRVSRAGVDRALEAALGAVKAGENPGTLRQLLDAATSAGAYCTAARAWARLRVVDPASMREFNPVKILDGCYAASPEVGGPNLLKNGDFARGFDGWSRPAAPNVSLELSREPQGGDMVVHVTARTADQRAILLQGARLQPDTAYVFEVTVKSTMSIVALYWESDVARFESEGTYRDWTTRRYVFVTPRWDGQPRSVDCFPFLLKEPGEVWLKQVKLVPLELGDPR